jgi:hypothetical protein
MREANAKSQIIRPIHKANEYGQNIKQINKASQ